MIEEAWGLLRRALGDPPAESAGQLDAPRLLGARQRTDDAVALASTHCQGAGATLAQQRAAIDGAGDHARQLAARARDLTASLERTRDALRRVQLLALNAALEGARIGDNLGKAMVSVADEVRAASGRGLESVEEHQGLLAALSSDRERVGELIDQARQRSATLADELLRSQSALRDASSALTELGTLVEAGTGTDAETARAVVEAGQHARALAAALARVPGRAEQLRVLRAIAPAVEPLVRVLGEDRKSE